MLQGGSIQHPLIWPGSIEPRLYQLNIASSAYGRNTLVILPTALGKTVISALVAAEVLYRHRDFKVMVLAPTRPLVMQHRRSFAAIMKLRESDVAFLTGKIAPENRRAIWDGDARVFFSTPEVVKNDLLEGRLSLKKFGLIVFDEAHRAVKEYAYTEIARTYVSQSEFPMILGMTASPGSTLERVMSVCRNLYIEKVEFRDEDDPDVKPYIHKIDIDWVKVDLPESYRRIKAMISSMLQKRVRWLYERKLLKVPPDMVTRRDLIEVGEELRYTLEAESIEEERSRIFDAIMTQSIALTLFHMMELIETQGIYTLREFMRRSEEEKGTRSHAILAADPDYQALRVAAESVKEEHPKLIALKKLVSEQLASNPQSRMLIFTQYRDTATHIVEELRSVKGVKADRFVGQASKGRDRGMSQDQQARMIGELEGGEINVMVSTSIAEEGLDIPAVDHVFFYEPIPSEIRYIQRRGRTGRKAPGKVTILAAEQTLDTAYLYSSMKRAKRMRWIASTINMKLQPVMRISQMPPDDPLTPSEILAIEREAGGPKGEPVEESEEDYRKQITKEVERASKAIYMRLMEAGREGMKIDEIGSLMEEEGLGQEAVMPAIEKLIKAKKVVESNGVYMTASAARTVNSKLHEVEVERIYPGSAVVRIDGKWRARLEPAEFNGPRNMIKRGSRFLASIDLYRVEGVLRIRVKEVAQKL